LTAISKGMALKYKEIAERPKKEMVAKTDLRVYNRPRKPSKDHPWRKEWKNWNLAPQKGAYPYEPN